jgi:hypothetical protein
MVMVRLLLLMMTMVIMAAMVMMRMMMITLPMMLFVILMRMMMILGVHGVMGIRLGLVMWTCRSMALRVGLGSRTGYRDENGNGGDVMGVFHVAGLEMGLARGMRMFIE